MAKFQFTPVIQSFVAAKQLVDANDPAAQKNHDRAVYTALMKPFGEVKAWYETYGKQIELAKTQAKSNMDAIENTIKKCKGQPSEAEMKLLLRSQELIDLCARGLKDSGDVLKTEMMDWRGGWDVACAQVVFDRQMLESIKAFRKGLIDKQTGVWNPLNERVDQYVVRAQALMTAVAKAAKNAPPAESGAEALEKLKKAHADALLAGPKGLKAYVQNIETETPNLKKEAKDGIHKDDRKNAAAIWKSKEPKFTQFGTLSKSLSGAEKTLELLLKSASSAAKGADKTLASAWNKLKDEIEGDLDAIQSATKLHAEAMKSIDKISEQYKAAIKGG